MNYVWGIDAGFNNSGVVVAKPVKTGIETLVHAVVIRTKSLRSKKNKMTVMLDDVQRLQTLARGLGELYEQYPPAFIAIEMPHAGAQGARANRCMAMATGVFVTWLAVYGKSYKFLQPSACKKAVLGIGRARKDETKEAVATKIELSFRGRVRFDWKDFGVRAEHLFDATAALVAGRLHYRALMQ